MKETQHGTSREQELATQAPRWRAPRRRPGSAMRPTASPSCPQVSILPQTHQTPKARDQPRPFHHLPHPPGETPPLGAAEIKAMKNLAEPVFSHINTGTGRGQPTTHTAGDQRKQAPSHRVEDAANIINIEFPSERPAYNLRATAMRVLWSLKSSNNACYPLLSTYNQATYSYMFSAAPGTQDARRAQGYHMDMGYHPLPDNGPSQPGQPRRSNQPPPVIITNMSKRCIIVVHVIPESQKIWEKYMTRLEVETIAMLEAKNGQALTNEDRYQASIKADNWIAENYTRHLLTVPVEVHPGHTLVLHRNALHAGGASCPACEDEPDSSTRLFQALQHATEPHAIAHPLDTLTTEIALPGMSTAAIAASLPAPHDHPARLTEDGTQAGNSSGPITITHDTALELEEKRRKQASIPCIRELKEYAEQLLPGHMLQETHLQEQMKASSQPPSNKHAPTPAPAPHPTPHHPATNPTAHAPPQTQAIVGDANLTFGMSDILKYKQASRRERKTDPASTLRTPPPPLHRNPASARPWDRLAGCSWPCTRTSTSASWSWT